MRIRDIEKDIKEREWRISEKIRAKLANIDTSLQFETLDILRKKAYLAVFYKNDNFLRISIDIEREKIKIDSNIYFKINEIHIAEDILKNILIPEFNKDF